jgi:pyrroline-5-carboxylate reductase
VILKALLDFGVSLPDISIQETNEQQCAYLKDAHKVRFGTNPNADIIILAVKPQQIGEIDFSKFSQSAFLFSIMAGTSIKKLEESS